MIGKSIKSKHKIDNDQTTLKSMDSYELMRGKNNPIMKEPMKLGIGIMK